MIHLIVTKHLAYSPPLQSVYERKSARLEDGDLGMNRLGDIWHGTNLPIPEGWQTEWIDLIEYEAIQQGYNS